MTYIPCAKPTKTSFSIVQFAHSLVRRIAPGSDSALRRPPSQATQLTPHLARDIGLSPAARERLNVQYPSQTTRHPGL